MPVLLIEVAADNRMNPAFPAIPVEPEPVVPLEKLSEYELTSPAIEIDDPLDSEMLPPVPLLLVLPEVPDARRDLDDEYAKVDPVLIAPPAVRLMFPPLPAVPAEALAKVVCDRE